MLRRSLSLLPVALSILLLLVATGCGDGGSSTSTAQTGAIAPEDQAVDGARVFAVNCSGCHGSEAKGAAGPDLRPLVETDLDRVKNQVANGGGPMPAFAKTLSESEINAVATYVVGLE
jgi:cytochrome c oxidase cbb3-type subunit 3